MKKKGLAALLAFLLMVTGFTGSSVRQAAAEEGVNGAAESVNATAEGSISISFDTQCDVTMEAVSVTPGETVSELPEGVRDEYVFAGWYKEAECENEFSTGTAIDADITLYADWKMKGDVDQNGVVEAGDALMILKYVANMIDRDTVTAVQFKQADVDLSGEIEANDALKVLKRVANMIKGFDVPEPTYYEKLGYENVTSEDELLAFPSADGYGKYTKGGRGGKVIYVTNLNDSGEGSLRAAVEAEGPRVVIFRVSGDIMLKSKLRIKNPYITIAGQTAPGDGICIRNYDVIIQTEHCILSYLRVRPGIYEAEGWTRQDIYNDGRKDCIWVYRSDNVVLDHVSASFGSDETISVTQSDNVTVQDCILSESLNATPYGGAHAMGSILCGGYGQKISYFRNLVATHRSRMPATGNQASSEDDTVGCDIEIVNNVFYNWQGDNCGNSHDETDVGPSRVNLINNYYKGGKESTSEYAWSTAAGNQQMYMSGNAMNGVVPKDQYTSLVQWSSEAVAGNLVDWDRYIMPDRCEKSILKNIVSAFDAYDYVMENAGCSLYRDDFDRGILQSVVDGKGKLINKPEQAYGWTGSWPVLEQTQAYTDADGDGMDDTWERKVGLNPEDPADANATVAGGYTNLEIFLESLTNRK